MPVNPFNPLQNYFTCDLRENKKKHSPYQSWHGILFWLTLYSIYTICRMQECSMKLHFVVHYL